MDFGFLTNLNVPKCQCPVNPKLSLCRLSAMNHFSLAFKRNIKKDLNLMAFFFSEIKYELTPARNNESCKILCSVKNLNSFNNYLQLYCH